MKKLLSDYDNELKQLAECYDDSSTIDRIKEISEETGFSFSKIDSRVRKGNKKLIEEKKNEEKKKVEVPRKAIIFSRRGQIEEFWNEQPFYYDKSKIFWLWNKEDIKWEISDEVDYLNSIQKILGIETIDSKTRIELIEGFKQIGRLHKPKDIEKSWVQFKEKIYDIKTGEEFKASPEYFVTNPIPWNVGSSEDTPMIEKLFIEWVGEENKQSLYEFIAYNISLDKFMQRIFAFCGGGSNGKGTLIKLNYKFLGEDNCVSSEVKSLSENQFEPAVLYRKLLCVMGEVSYDDLKNTNMFKKLGGEDKLSFQFKGKTPFTADNTATCVCLTNSLPTTPDKSLGFYRKWKIEDFPNQFIDVKRDLINSIPDIEFENLAKKSLRILKELYKTQKFYNEGDFEVRRKRYEERSNPVIQFVDEFCEEIAETNISLREFTNLCNNYLKVKHLRVMNAKQIGKVLRDEGFSVGSRKNENGSSVVILNLIYKGLPLKPLKPSKSQLDSYIEPISILDGINGINGNTKGNNNNIDYFNENSNEMSVKELMSRTKKDWRKNK